MLVSDLMVNSRLKIYILNDLSMEFMERLNEDAKNDTFCSLGVGLS